MQKLKCCEGCTAIITGGKMSQLWGKEVKCVKFIGKKKPYKDSDLWQIDKVLCCGRGYFDEPIYDNVAPDYALTPITGGNETFEKEVDKEYENI